MPRPIIPKGNSSRREGLDFEMERYCDNMAKALRESSISPPKDEEQSSESQQNTVNNQVK